MKIFKKFKQFSRDIKLIIITALIVSCVGVYAAGTCIISATADDVSYNNTSVQAALDDLYSLSQSCPEGYECERNNLYSKMAKGAVLDNIASTYVTSSTGIDFSQISSDTNGKGIYEIASTKDDDYPIYYYRGAVDNNNVKFGGFCWKAIRTTDTGGVKLIYNGEPDQDGYCTNTTGVNTTIGSNYYKSSHISPAYVGYMYGKVYTYNVRYDASLNRTYVFGKDVTYSGGTYTLTNTKTITGTWSNDYNTLNNYHYTCWTTGTTCTSVYYAYYTTNNSATYITLTNGKKVNDALDEMFTNITNTGVKTDIDTWYNTNLSNYTSYIEDTIYCNDRSIGELGGWNPNGGNNNTPLYFSAYTRLKTNYTPSLTCSRELDRFTVSSLKGNGALTYPVGLITADEAMYAGGKDSTTNNTYYLYTNQEYFSISPYLFRSFQSNYGYEVTTIASYGSISSSYDDDALGIRPVISIASTTSLSSGDGTATNPYVIQTS